MKNLENTSTQNSHIEKANESKRYNVYIKGVSEKAIEVLDVIQNAYEMSLYCDHAFDQSANVMRPYIFVDNKVFQMPQDEEMGE